MPYKDKEKKKAHSKSYGAEYYRKNRTRILKNNAENRKRLKSEWIAFKSEQRCTHCGFSHPAALDFHHVERRPSNRSVNELVSNGRFSEAYKEVKNCIPLCANCHRIHHWDEHRGKDSQE